MIKLLLRGDVSIKKYVSIGLIVSLLITRDELNKTYKKDIDFINDKDNIIKVLSKDLNISLYDVITNNNSIEIKLKKEVINKNLSNLNNSILKSTKYNFCNLNQDNINSNIVFMEPFDSNNLDEIDKDLESSNYPITITTKAIEIIRTTKPINMTDEYDSLLELEDYIKTNYRDNALSNALVYGVE